ncbi:MAG: oligosaccharide flippase family protein [Burkholderiales bacterium]|nr:oligosaccharide flippase family protein [Burkholderiales bacterium]
MREVWLKISGATGAKAYNLALSVATLSLTARLLGPEGRGQVGAVIAWVALFSTLGHLSLGSVAIRQLAIDRDAAKVSELLGSLAVYTCLLTLLGWMLAILMAALPETSAFGTLPVGLLILGFLSLPFLLWQTYGQSLLMGLDMASRFNRATMLGRTVNLVAIYVLVGWLAWGETGAIVSALLAGIVSAGGGMRALYLQAGRKFAPRLRCISTLASGAVRLHLNAIGTYLFTQSGVLVVNHFHGATATGNYQLAAQLIAVMLIIPNAVSQTMYGLVTKRGPDAAWPINRHVLHRAMLITAGSILLAWFLAPYMIPLIAGEGFSEAVHYFRMMLPMLLGGTLSAAMAAQWIGRGLFWQASTLTLFVGLCGISSSWILTPQYGPVGAIYATLIGYSIGAAFNLALYAYCARRSRRATE